MLEDLARLLRTNIPLIAVALILIILGLNQVIPNFFGEAQSIARTILAVMAASAGIYIIYSSGMSRSKVDDLLGLLFGSVLLGIAAYMGFGVNIASMLTQFASAMKTFIPYILAATLALVGMYLLQRRGISQLIGLFLVIAALSILGVNLLGVFKW